MKSTRIIRVAWTLVRSVLLGQNTNSMVGGFGTKKPSANVKIRGPRKVLMGFTKRGKPKMRWPRVYAWYRATGDTCPTSCIYIRRIIDGVLKLFGCYADVGNVAIHSNRARKTQSDLLGWGLALPHGASIRWVVSGDFGGEDGELYLASVLALHILRPDLLGWGYTHLWYDQAILDAVTFGIGQTSGRFWLAASADSPEEQQQAKAMGWLTTTIGVDVGSGDYSIATAKETRAKGLYPCPAQIKGLGVGCMTCGGGRPMCMKPGDIGFAFHGSSRKAAVQSAAGRRALPMVAA
jgi:hypothetical protein